jgi:hypothetical protein
MEYEQPRSISRGELEKAFRGNDGERIREALISASYSEDASWLVDSCLKLAGDERSVVRQGVALVLGYIAIDPRGEVDLKRCLEAAERLTDDPDEATRMAALDSVDDVLHAIRLQSTGKVDLGGRGK